MCATKILNTRAIPEIYVMYITIESIYKIITIIDIITLSIRLTVTVLQAFKFIKKFIEVAKIKCHEQ